MTSSLLPIRTSREKEILIHIPLINGHMFTHLTPEGVLAIRLPEKEREIFIKKYKTKLMESYGVVRKEYAVVPESLLKKTNELKPYLDISYSYIKTLKPKPATKNKK
jgi:hypothetical protein